MTTAMVPLGDISQQIRGVTYKKTDAKLVAADGYEMLLRANNIADESIIFDDVVHVPSSKVSRKQVLLEHDVVIAASSGSLKVVGKSAAFGGGPRVTFGAFCKAIRPDTNKVDPRYFFHAFRTVDYRRHVERRAAGANINNLRKEDIDEYEIPLPRMEEQRRIAGILDAADALRRRRREALALLDTLPGAIFADMFGDRLYGIGRATDYVPLEKVAHIQSGITKGRRLKSGEETEKTAYLAVVNVQDKRLDLSNVKMIEATTKERARYALAAGDLLLTEGGDPDKLGRGTVWNDEIPGAIHQNHIFRVRVRDEKVQPVFLSHLLSSTYGRGYFLRMAKQTTGIASINKTQLSGFPAILPDEDEQTEFVQRLNSCQDQTERHISHLGEVDGLFASLQSRAFAGEL